MCSINRLKVDLCIKPFVYGGNKKIPFSVEDRVDNPISLYA